MYKPLCVEIKSLLCDTNGTFGSNFEFALQSLQIPVNSRSKSRGTGFYLAVLRFLERCMSRLNAIFDLNCHNFGCDDGYASSFPSVAHQEPLLAEVDAVG